MARWSFQQACLAVLKKPGWKAARWAGVCSRCGRVFNLGVPIKKDTGDWVSVCCEFTRETSKH